MAADDSDDSGARPMPLPAVDEEPRTLEPNMRAPSMKPTAVDRVLLISAKEGAAALALSLPSINDDEPSTEQTTKKVSSPPIPREDEPEEEETRTTKLAARVLPPSRVTLPSAPEVDVEVEVTEKMAVPGAAQPARPMTTVKMTNQPRSSSNIALAATEASPQQTAPLPPPQPVAFPILQTPQPTPAIDHAPAPPMTPSGVVAAVSPPKKSRAWMLSLLVIPAALGGVGYWKRAVIFPAKPIPSASGTSVIASADTSVDAIPSSVPSAAIATTTPSASASAPTPAPSASSKRRRHH